MAGELARYGLSVRIVDKDMARTDKSKAIVVWARTLELLDRMGSGCTESFVSAGLKAEAANILSGKDEIAHINLSHVDSPYKFVLMIAQSETERLLEAQLTTLGLNVERQTELTRFAATADCVSCTLAHSDGHEEKVEADWLIGCDGAHSTVRPQLGMGFEGNTLLNDWILADVHLDGIAGPPAINIYWHAEGVLALFPLGGTRYRVIADVGESAGSIGEGNRPTPTLAEVQQVLNVRGPQYARARDAVWLSAFSINERKVSDYRSGRIFLAGDAAHVHSPAGGQGMNTGMHDAFNLAWKLALVAKGLCPASLLDSYSAERNHIAKLLLEATGKATTMAVLKGGVKQAIRNHVAALVLGFPPVKHEVANLLSEVAVAYSDSPLNASRAHFHDPPKPGHRAPIRNNESPVGSGRTPRFALFAAVDAMLPPLREKWGNLLETAVREPFHSDGLWLVRPDGYVALAAKAGDWDAVDKYLARIS